MLSDRTFFIAESGIAIVDINTLFDPTTDNENDKISFAFSKNQMDTIRTFSCKDQGMKMVSAYIFQNGMFSENQLCYFYIDDKFQQCEDRDQDGFMAFNDCDDTNAKMNPDQMDIPDNGIDEDCSGKDAKALPVLSEWGLLSLLLLKMIVFVRMMQTREDTKRSKQFA